MEASREFVISSILPSSSAQPKWVYTHFYRKHDQATLLIGSEVHRGLLQPVIDGLHLGRSLICCTRHQRRAADCFGQPLCKRTKDTYSDIREYQSVIEPLLVNESAINSTSTGTCHIVLKGLRLSWMQDANKGERRSVIKFLPRTDECGDMILTLAVVLFFSNRWWEIFTKYHLSFVVFRI